MGSKRRESNAGAAPCAHDQGQAERILQLGTRLLGLRVGGWARMPHGQTEKRSLGLVAPPQDDGDAAMDCGEVVGGV